MPAGINRGKNRLIPPGGINLPTLDRLDALENKSIRKMSDQIESVTRVVSDHAKLVDTSAKNQAQVAYKQEKLLERSLRELHEQKDLYADIVKGSCDKVAKNMSAELNEMKRKCHWGSDSISRRNLQHDWVVMDKERRKLNVVIFNLPEVEPVEMESRNN